MPRSYTTFAERQARFRELTGVSYSTFRSWAERGARIIQQHPSLLPPELSGYFVYAMQVPGFAMGGSGYGPGPERELPVREGTAILALLGYVYQRMGPFEPGNPKISLAAGSPRLPPVLRDILRWLYRKMKSGGVEAQQYFLLYDMVVSSAYV
jgi:hypothetical protein